MSPTQFRAQQHVDTEDRWLTPEESWSAATEMLRQAPLTL
jgi:hypothetical protein